MLQTVVFGVPVELRLKFVAIVRSYGADAEWKLRDDIIEKVYGVLLSMALVDCLDGGLWRSW